MEDNVPCSRSCNFCSANSVAWTVEAPFERGCAPLSLLAQQCIVLKCNQGVVKEQQLLLLPRSTQNNDFHLVQHDVILVCLENMPSQHYHEMCRFLLLMAA